MPPPHRKKSSGLRTREKPEIFIVHGHNVEIRETVARFIEKIGCKPIILHELPNKGKTIFQKFTTNSGVEFAIVLLTGDDEGGPAKGARKGQHKRARQNVILELGFFLGKLGVDKVCSLYEEGVELPSDYHGVVYLPLNGEWKRPLVRELISIGIEIDSNELLTI